MEVLALALAWPWSSPIQLAPAARSSSLWNAFHEKALLGQGRFSGSLVWLPGRSAARRSVRVFRRASMRTLMGPRVARCSLGSVQSGRCYLSGGLLVVSVDHGRLDQAFHRSHPDWAIRRESIDLSGIVSSAAPAALAFVLAQTATPAGSCTRGAAQRFVFRSGS